MTLKKWTVIISASRSRRKAWTPLGTIILACVSVILFLTAPAIADDQPQPDPGTVGVALRPAGADGQPDDRSRFEYAADPGQSVTDQVYVGNTGTERQDFTVYATDAFNATDGGFSLLATEETPTGIGTWVHFDDGSNRLTFSLEPDEVRLVTFTLEFPADASPGDHVGGIVASVLQEGAQVSVDRRVATGIFARVSGELQPSLTISSVDATYAGDWWNPFAGSVKVLYSVNNTGNVALAGNVTGDVSTWFGIPAGAPQGGGFPVLLPGSSATYELDLPGVGQWGYLNPVIDLQPFVDSSTSEFQLSINPVRRDTVTFAVPWSLLILVGVGVATWLLLRWRRRVDERRAEEWMAYTEAQAAAARESEKDAVR